MENGWIKIYRKLLDNPISSKPNYLALWVHLLLMASHEDTDFIWNGNVIKLKKGQFVTGRKQLSHRTGIKETTIERVLDLYEKCGKIGQQKTTKYRLITILKWNEYQVVDSKRTTNGQQTDTFKKYKNNKNINSIYSEGEPSHEINQFINLFKEVNPNYERLFSNKTERACADRLIKKFGIEKMTSALQKLPGIISQPYAPKITTPYELEKNLGKLITFVEQSKNLLNNKKSNVI